MRFEPPCAPLLGEQELLHSFRQKHQADEQANDEIRALARRAEDSLDQ